MDSVLDSAGVFYGPTQKKLKLLVMYLPPLREREMQKLESTLRFPPSSMLPGISRLSFISSLMKYVR